MKFNEVITKYSIGDLVRSDQQKYDVIKQIEVRIRFDDSLSEDIFIHYKTGTSGWWEECVIIEKIR